VDVVLRLHTVGDLLREARGPLLVVLDGPDYARRATLLRLLRRLAGEGAVPPHRVALVRATDRFDTYSASAPYARALSAALDEVTGRGRGRRVGLGSSLGALALLHAHRLEPRTFSGLFLQSGAYFRRRTDPQERRFPHFSRIDRFVGTVLQPKDRARPVPVTLTCGLDEENYACNAAVAQALAAQGYPVGFHAARGGHDWPNWRRSLESHLAPLLARVWR
jgi:enterochelin esterase family protein